MKIEESDFKKILAENKSVEEIINASSKAYVPKSVLGVDIYKYSEYKPAQQMYIPVLFDYLYQATVKNCLNAEPLIFQHYTTNLKGFQKRFISTGDGGFQIFDTPLEAIIFSIYFQLHIKRFNSGGDSTYLEELKRLRELIGKIELRYAITLDSIYAYNNNFYGPGIINNARILSKDNLNRLLIDENVLDWFDSKINSIENLSVLKREDFQKIELFKYSDLSLATNLFANQNIKTVDVLKIGAIKIKSTELKVYNLHIQAGLSAKNENLEVYNYYSTTIGNLNTKGIE